MKRHHREVIVKNMEALVKETDLDSVRDRLLQKGVFNKRMVEPFENQLRNRSDRIKDMYFYVETRGPNAFSKLIETLMETGHLELAKRLDPSCNPEAYLTDLNSQHRRDGLPPDVGNDVGDVENITPPSRKRCHPSILPQYMMNENSEALTPHTLATLGRTSLINVGTEPFPIKVKLATERLDRSYLPDLHVYPMGSSPKGLVLLINNVEFIAGLHAEREGAEVDERNMKELFTQLGYQVTSFQNQGIQDMKNKIKDFAKRKELSHVCSLVVAIMSHGHGGHHNNSQIIASDGVHLDTSWILEQFSSSNCPDMVKKPKIFIFQACEGNNMDFGVQISDDRTRTQADGYAEASRVRLMADMLVANSTYPGYISHRDRFLGTWFIQAICEVFMEYACNHNIEDMLKMVDNRLSSLRSEYDTVQTSCYKSVGFQKFFFNPGLYDDAEVGIEPVGVAARMPAMNHSEMTTTLEGDRVEMITAEIRRSSIESTTLNGRIRNDV